MVVRLAVRNAISAEEIHTGRGNQGGPRGCHVELPRPTDNCDWTKIRSTQVAVQSENCQDTPSDLQDHTVPGVRELGNLHLDKLPMHAWEVLFPAGHEGPSLFFLALSSDFLDLLSSPYPKGLF